MLVRPLMLETGIRRSRVEKGSCEFQAFHLTQNMIKNFGSFSACSPIPEMVLFNGV